MVISLRDVLKFFGVTLICACAAFVCFLFLSYSIELREMAPDIAPGVARIVYDGQVATAKVVVAVTGGALVSTALIVLFFYIAQYVDAHSRELGVLKALGWSTNEIARGFSLFGLNGALGAGIGCAAAIQQLPPFLHSMNEDELLPAAKAAIHPELFLYLVVLPGVLFAGLAVFYAARRLRMPALSLIRGIPASAGRRKLPREREESFLRSARRSVLRASGSLAFFVFIGAFCFACMLQMSGSMTDLASEWIGGMMIIIGIVLAVTCLTLSTATAIRRCAPSAAIMRACGYTAAECRDSLLGCFRPFAYVGFAAGTIYQYVLLRLILDFFYADYPLDLDLSFNAGLMIGCLALFAVFYEGALIFASRKVLQAKRAPNHFRVEVSKAWAARLSLR